MSDVERSSVVVAVTGGIACGKSEVGRILGEMGFVVGDADRMAHTLMAKGTPVYQSIVDCFGTQILADDGEISRPLLGQIVFEHPEQLMQLNSLVHPAVKEVLVEWISERRSRGEKAAVQVPLLFESGMEKLDWDTVICVSSSDELVLKRLEMRGIPQDEAVKRINSQMALPDKEQLSDCVIQNLGTLQELERATRTAVESLVVER